VSTVSHVVGLRLLAWGREVTLPTRFCYDEREPFEVRAVFGAGLAAEPVEWVLARSLLADGMHGPAGDGDVRTRPSASHRHLVIELSSPSGAVRFEAPAAEVARFLDATFRLVPDGAEPPRDDIDAGIDAIFAEHGPR